MKRVIAFLVLAVIAYQGFGQMTVVTGSSISYLNTPKDGQEHKLYHKMVNIGTSAEEIKFRVTNSSAPGGWGNGWSTNGMCYTLGTSGNCLPTSLWGNFTTLTVNPGDTLYLYAGVLIQATAQNGCSRILIEVLNAASSNLISNLEFVHTTEANTSNCWPLSIKDTKLNSEALSVYPNPVIDVLNLKVQNTNVKSVVLTNVIGKRLNAFGITDNRVGKIYNINISGYPSGVYLLQYKDAQGKTLGVHRITKQ